MGMIMAQNTVEIILWDGSNHALLSQTLFRRSSGHSRFRWALCLSGVLLFRSQHPLPPTNHHPEVPWCLFKKHKSRTGMQQS